MAAPLDFLLKMPHQTDQLVDEPPVDETDQVHPPLRIVFEALGDVTHEAEPPAAPVLEAQALHFAAMLVEDEKSGLVDEDIARPDDPVEDVKIAPAGNSDASVQCLIEASH